MRGLLLRCGTWQAVWKGHLASRARSTGRLCCLQRQHGSDTAFKGLLFSSPPSSHPYRVVKFPIQEYQAGLLFVPCYLSTILLFFFPRYILESFSMGKAVFCVNSDCCSSSVEMLCFGGWAHGCHDARYEADLCRGHIGPHVSCSSGQQAAFFRVMQH